MIRLPLLVLLVFNFAKCVTGTYTAESSLGQCFRDTSEGYILLFDRSFVDCVRECKRRRRCQTIRYDRGTLICMLYPKSSIPQTSTSGCFQSSREEFKNRYALEGSCEKYHTKCKINETCSLNSTTLEPFCETLDCAERPTSPQHAEPLYYVDSKVGSVAKFQCKSYVEFPQGRGVAVCSAQGEWNWTEVINCTVPRDCLELFEHYDIRDSGPHYISPDNRTVVRAYCDMETDGGGWTVVQRRNSSDVKFTRGWNEYKDGFGEATGNYWIGNDILHALTMSGSTMRVQLKSFDGTPKHANYSNFRVSDEESKYTMTYDCFIGGDAGDALEVHNVYENGNTKNMAFSTIDRDNDKSKNNCAAQYKGGWWYNACTSSNLNGEYCQTGQNCMTWTTYKEYPGHQETMISVRRT